MCEGGGEGWGSAQGPGDSLTLMGSDQECRQGQEQGLYTSPESALPQTISRYNSVWLLVFSRRHSLHVNTPR